MYFLKQVLNFLFRHFFFVKKIYIYINKNIHNVLSKIGIISIITIVSIAFSHLYIDVRLKHLENEYTIDHVNNDYKIRRLKKWLENKKHEFCADDKECKAYVRSFKFHLNKNSGIWCMTHKNTQIDDSYFDQEEIHASEECKAYLFNINEITVHKKVLESKCKHLAKKCLFTDPKIKDLEYSTLKCKLSNPKVNDLMICIAVVGEEKLKMHHGLIDDFIIKND